jgi:hypothetical protein
MKQTLGSALIILASLLLNPAQAQSPAAAAVTATVPDYEPPLLTGHVSTYRDKRRVILEAIERMDAPIPERLAVYDREMRKLRDEFTSIRRKEYASVNAPRAVEHSCTKGGSGGKKDCGWKCTTSPSPDVIPIASTIRVEETNKGTMIQGAGACLKMTKAGRGRNFGRLHVDYRFSPEAIERRLSDDTSQLFELIGRNG